MPGVVGRDSTRPAGCPRQPGPSIAASGTPAPGGFCHLETKPFVSPQNRRLLTDVDKVFAYNAQHVVTETTLVRRLQKDFLTSWAALSSPEEGFGHWKRGGVGRP